MVADVRLGDFNGIQLGILAKNAWPDVRIVIMSGWDDPVLTARGGATRRVIRAEAFQRGRVAISTEVLGRLTLL